MIAVVIAILTAIVGVISSGPNDLLKGFAIGAAVVSVPIVVRVLYGLVRSEITIGGAQKTALEYLETRDQREKHVVVHSVELTEKKWVVSGSYWWMTRPGATDTIPLTPPPPDVEFEIIVDSRTGNVLKYAKKSKHHFE